MTGTGHDGSEGRPGGTGREGSAWRGAGKGRGLAG